jgi:uncharacterized protein (TIGR02996 family)
VDAEERGFRKALQKDPNDSAACSAFADWLDEHDRPYEAAQLRSRAGLSEVFYQIRRKSDGLFSTANRANWQAPMRWATKGKMWRRLADLHSHIRNAQDRKTYGGTPWEDVEVFVTEVRVTFSTVLPFQLVRHTGWAGVQATAIEPVAAPDEPG